MCDRSWIIGNEKKNPIFKEEKNRIAQSIVLRTIISISTSRNNLNHDHAIFQYIKIQQSSFFLTQVFWIEEDVQPLEEACESINFESLTTSFIRELTCV
jgi:hypothetical protein